MDGWQGGRVRRFVLGSMVGEPLARRPHLVAAPVRAGVERLGLGEEIGVVEIDPALSETAATQERYDLDAASLVNCVVVAGHRGGEERVAACLVPATKRVDVNGVVRRRLDVRKASFMSQADAVERTGMEHGGITPIGLPAGWPVLVDADAVPTALVVIGSGIRASKLLVPGELLARLSGAEVVEGLGRA